MEQVDDVPRGIGHFCKGWPICDAREQHRPNSWRLGRRVREQRPWYIDHCFAYVTVSDRQRDIDGWLVTGKPSLIEPAVVRKCRYSFCMLTKFVSLGDWIRVFKERNQEFQFIVPLHSRRASGVLDKHSNSDAATVIAELKRTGDYKVSRNPRTLGHFQLLRASLGSALSGIGSSLGSVSRISIRRVHFDRVCGINRKKDYTESLCYKFGSSGLFSDVRYHILAVRFESLPEPINTIAKYTKITILSIMALIFIVIGLAVVQYSLPRSSGNMIGVNLLIGIGSLLLGFWLIWLLCSSVSPADSDSRPVTKALPPCVLYGPVGLRKLQDLPHDALELPKLRRLSKLLWRGRRRLYVLPGAGAIGFSKFNTDHNPKRLPE
jgi:hypothetical protein